MKVEKFLVNSASIVNEILSLNFSVYEKRCDSLNKILIELRSQYVSMPFETKKSMGDYIASSSSTAVILNFMCKLSERESKIYIVMQLLFICTHIHAYINFRYDFYCQN